LMNPGVVSIGGSAQPDWFKIFKDSIEEAKAVEKKTSKEVTDLEEKNFDYKDKKNIDNVYGEAFLEGYYTEMKDPKNADKSVDELKEMVAKNLAKDQLHYVKDGQFGTKGVGYTDDLPGLKASDTDQMVPVKEGKERVGLLDIMESYSEFQRDDKGAKGVDKKDKGEEDAYGAGVEKGEEIEKKKMKKESVKDRVKEIEKQGSIAALEAKMNALEEEIEMRETKLRMVDENEDLAEFVNPKKLAETKREIKELEKAKDKYKKMHEKMCGGAKKEIVEDNETLEEGETIDESKFKEGDFVRLKNDDGLGPKFAVISTRKMFASKLHAVRVTDENGKTAEYDETQLELA